jgi:hypothetical protein
MRRVVTLLLVVALSAGSVPTTVYGQDADSVSLMRRARSAGDSATERMHLERITRQLEDPIGTDALLMWMYAEHRLGHDEAVRSRALAFVTAHRLDFRSLVERHAVMSPDEKRECIQFLEDIASRAPLIDSLTLETPSVFPFREGAGLSLSATITGTVDLALELDGRPAARASRVTGRQKLFAPVREDWVRKTSFEFTLRAANELGSVEVSKPYSGRLVLPPNLTQAAGGFQLVGETPRPETRTIRKKSAFWLIGAVLFGAGAVAVAASSPPGEGYLQAGGKDNRSQNAAALGGLAVGYVALWQLLRKAPMQVPDEAAVRFNRDLQRRTDVLKTDVRLDLEEDMSRGGASGAAPDDDREGRLKRLGRELEAGRADENAWREASLAPVSSQDSLRERQTAVEQYLRSVTTRERLLREVAQAGGEVSWSEEQELRRRRAEVPALRAALEREQEQLEKAELQRSYAALERRRVQLADSGGRASGELVSILQQMQRNREAAIKRGIAGASGELAEATAALAGERQAAQIAELQDTYIALKQRHDQVLENYTRAFGTPGQQAAAGELLALLERMHANRVEAREKGAAGAAEQVTVLEREIERTKRQQRR